MALFFRPPCASAIASSGAPAAKALLALVPAPNNGNQYVAFTAGPVNIDQGTIDILHQISSSDQLHGFYAYQKDVRTEPALQGNTIPGFGDHRTGKRQILTLNETHVFNSHFVNEARLGFNRIGITFTPATQLDPANFNIGDGITAAIGIPQITGPGCRDWAQLRRAIRLSSGSHGYLWASSPTLRLT